jgi:hypothetical protein
MVQQLRIVVLARVWRWLAPLALALGLAAQSRPAGPAQAAPVAFQFGQQVEARSPGVSINLRREPGLAGRVVTTLPNGTTATVIGGPRPVDGVNWWQVDAGLRAAFGWVAEGLLAPAPPAPAPDEAARRAGCALVGPAYAGLYHCQRAAGVHVVVIDLNDPHVRFETVMAQDAIAVDTAAQEWVSDMAQRHPGAVAAINGDYFSPGLHGPEGLTVRNGTRLDGLHTMERSALIIGQAPLDAPGVSIPIPATIARPADARVPVEPARLFNAVGGGPQIVFNARWSWQSGFVFPGFRGCAGRLPPDQVVNGECLADINDWLEPAKPWSAAGLTPDHKMVWVVGPFAHLAETLAAFDVETALKLDSGGSSQLWYHRTMVPGFRPVANGLLAFYQRSAEVVTRSRWPVRLEGERLRLTLRLRNTGADAWPAGRVALTGPGGQTVPLTDDVPPGATVTLSWLTDPAQPCGVHREAWHLAWDGQTFPGPAVEVGTITLPAGRAGERSRLAAQVRAWLQGPERGQPPAFLAQLERELQGACGV